MLDGRSRLTDSSYHLHFSQKKSRKVAFKKKLRFQWTYFVDLQTHIFRDCGQTWNKARSAALQTIRFKPRPINHHRGL